MSATVALGPFAPDAASVDSGVLVGANNVFSLPNGYGPVKGLSAVTTALPGPCKGAISVKDKSGATMFFAGTQSALYKFDPVTLGWADVSRAGSSYFVPPDDYWSFAQFGTSLIAVHVNDGAQVLDIETGTLFTALGGSPPRARFVSTVGDFVLLGGLVDYPRRVHWSDLNNSTQWTPGIGLSDVQDFPDGGNVTGVAGGEFGVVFQEKSIRRMTFVPGSAEIFQFDKAEDSRGSIAPWSIVRVGARTFFLDRDGFYLFAGQSSPIGDGKINTWLSTNADIAYLGRAVAAADVRGSRVFWFIKSVAASNPDQLDRVLVYDWQLDRWSLISVSARFAITAATPGTSIDSIGTSIDAISTSFDSLLYAGGTPTVGVFSDGTNILSFFEGGNLEALVETADAQLARPNRAFLSGVRVDTDAASLGVTIGTKEALGAAPAWGVEGAPEATQIVPFRSSSRYHRARIRIPAGQSWSYLTGLEIDASAEGMR